MDGINKCFRYILERVNERRKGKLITLSIYDHHLIKSNQIFSLNELSSRELYPILIVKNNENLFLNRITTLFVRMTTLDWRKIYLLPRIATIKRNYVCFNIKF